MSPPLAMWEREAQVVELEKSEAGLGFSILDYQVRHGPEISTDRADKNIFVFYNKFSSPAIGS